MDESVFKEVRQLAAETFQTEEKEVTADSSPDTLENWDSIQHLNFVLALEARFQIELSAEDMEGARSIADAVRIVEARISR